MGDSGEGLVDADARIQEQMEEREAERKRRSGAPPADPERVREIESLRLAKAELERQAQTAAALKEARAKLQPGDVVHVPKYDKEGRVVRVDLKKNVAVVSLGLGQWEVALDEVFPRY